MRKLYCILTALLIWTGAYGQNISNVLASLENYQLITLKNGLRVQVISTPAFRDCVCKLSADVSDVSDGVNTGIKDMVAEMAGGALISNEMISKTLILHKEAVDSALTFIHSTIYGTDPMQMSFQDFKDNRIRRLRASGKTDRMMVKEALGLPVATAQKLESISESAYMDMKEICFSPERCLITIIGDYNVEDIRTKVNELFGQIRKTPYKGRLQDKHMDPMDEIWVIDDTSAQSADVLEMHFYKCDKTPKNYVINAIAFNMTYVDMPAQSLSNKRYDINTISTSKGYESLMPMVKTVFGPRDAGFDMEAALQNAKSATASYFQRHLADQIFLADKAAELVLYALPRNFFSYIDQHINAIGTSDMEAFVRNTIQKGRSLMLIRGNQREMHCDLMDMAKDRDVCFLDKDGKIDSRVKKGFGAQMVLDIYLKSTGLDNPPANMMATYKSAYMYPDGNIYAAGGKIMRKLPNMYRMDNFVQHDDTMRIFHFKELYDGITAMDSSMLYGMAPADSIREIQLMQKATFPQEAKYDELGFDYKLICDYKNFKDGVHVIELTDLCGRHYRDYYSIRSGLRELSEILDDNGQVIKFIMMEYQTQGQYTLPKTVREVSNDMRIELVFSVYDLNTKWKKTDFQLKLPLEKKKR